MRKVHVLLVLGLVLGLLGFLLLACTSYQTSEANKLIKDANASVEAYNKLQEEINTAWDELNALPKTTQADWQQRLTKGQEIEGKVKAQHTEIEKALELVKKAKALNVSSELKQYFQMLIDSWELRLEANNLALEITQQVTQMHQQLVAGTATEASVDALSKKVDELLARGKELEKQATALKEKADRYFEEHNLGD